MTIMDKLAEVKGKVVRWIVFHAPLVFIISGLARILDLWAHGVRNKYLIQIHPLDATGGQLLTMLMHLDRLHETTQNRILKDVGDQLTNACGVLTEADKTWYENNPEAAEHATNDPN